MQHQHTPRPRPHLPIGIILAVVGLVALVLLVRELRATFDPIERAAREQAAWEAQRRDAALSGVDLFVAGAWRVLPLMLVSGGALVAGALVWRRWATHEYIKAAHVTRLTQAQAQRFPSGLQSLSFHDSSKPMVAPPAEPLALPEPEPAKVPSFGQLLDQGQIGPGRPLLLGFDASTGQPLTGSWASLYSVGVGGVTGSGKSWLAAFLISQSAAAGARLIVVDPHAGDAESLSNRIAGLSSAFMCDVASTGAQIDSALKLAASKLEARKAGRGGAWPILLICDEWTSLLRGKLGDLLTATALDIAEQGRKYGVFAMLAAQAWQVDAAGPVRDRLASHYTMRTRGDQFRYQMGLRGSAPLDTLFLQPGQAYFLSVRGDLTKVQIPKIEPQDITRIGALIAQPAAAVGAPFGFAPATRVATPIAAQVAADRPESSQNVAGRPMAYSAPGAATVASAEATRAAALFVAGSSPAEIVKELRNVGSKEGARYQSALNDILNLIREGMRGNQ